MRSKTRFLVCMLSGLLLGGSIWHRIKIKVNPPAGFPHVVVRTREGYYSASKPVNVRETR